MEASEQSRRADDLAMQLQTSREELATARSAFAESAARHAESLACRTRAADEELVVARMQLAATRASVTRLSAELQVLCNQHAMDLSVDDIRRCINTQMWFVSCKDLHNSRSSLRC